MCEKARMTAPILFYFDFISPFARLGAIGIERLAAELGRPVEWRPVLIGVTVLEIMGMKPLPLTPLKGPYLKRDLERLSEWLDVPVPRHGLKGINSVAAAAQNSSRSHAGPNRRMAPRSTRIDRSSLAHRRALAAALSETSK